PRATADRGSVPDHDALADRGIRPDGHVRADDGIVTDGDAVIDSGAGVDLDILTELRSSPLLRDRYVGLAPGDRPELAPVAGLPLAHLRTGACSRLRRRHDRFPSSWWPHLMEVGGAVTARTSARSCRARDRGSGSRTRRPPWPARLRAVRCLRARPGLRAGASGSRCDPRRTTYRPAAPRPLRRARQRCRPRGPTADRAACPRDARARRTRQ